MKIVVDENIPYGNEAFSQLGEVVTLPGRAIAKADLMDAQALMVRSITKVNADLLEGTDIQFVATATIGEDHIDKPYLKSNNIGFSSAPGCNANSVGEYIAAALLHFAEKHSMDLTQASLGIIGVGNVGKKVLAKAKALGMRCILNDPPLAGETAEPIYRPLEEALACDFVTTHVPLSKDGPYPTFHLADQAFFDAMGDDAIYLNSSRGAVADNQALKATLKAGKLRDCLLDVWEGEPEPDMELVDLVEIATPHIAGYSFDGKVDGTQQIYDAACRHFKINKPWDPTPLLPEPECPALSIDTPGHAGIHAAIRAVYEIMNDDKDFRGLNDCPAEEHAVFFDQLRKNYPRRREFQNTIVSLGDAAQGLAPTVDALGFRRNGSC